MKLQDLLAMATDQALARLNEEGLATGYPEEERLAIARMVGIGAVKFADLSNHRLSNYIFDLDRFTRFEGRSEEHTSELQSLMRISYAVFCLKKKKHTNIPPTRA